MSGAPILLQNEHRREYKEPSLCHMLQHSSNPQRNPLDNKFLQNERSERPHKKERPNSNTKKVILFESIVK